MIRIFYDCFIPMCSFFLPIELTQLNVRTVLRTSELRIFNPFLLSHQLYIFCAREMSAKLQIARLGGSKEYIDVDLNMSCSELVQKIAEKKVSVKRNNHDMIVFYVLSAMISCEQMVGKTKRNNRMLKHDETKSLSQLNIKNDDKLILMNKPVTKKEAPEPEVDKKEEESKDPNEVPQTGSAMDIQLDNATSRMEKLEEIKKAAEKMAQRYTLSGTTTVAKKEWRKKKKKKAKEFFYLF
ncbi:hypothetical protein RFI_21398 [Reticulomyxa filosa]|uniref:Uncharacterized protein n=1 Tax=Reticulomyxa filosa TaxID=46433 RepID=X6MPP4_RETFI|nr:hypothetical protein RFI_21398 [Reticulomyxa filosa]|eukprot:ETO15963.1 hypothetical protein RFI_21398 [Reticulomyxa filosa]